MQAIRRFLRLYAKPQMRVMLALGFASGLPLALTASTLFAWLADMGVNYTTIGLFASISIPYSIKFLWAPLIDSLPLPLFDRWLGRRRGWLLAIQIALMAAIACFAFVSPQQTPLLLAIVGLAVAFFSASQDIVIDAYRVEAIAVEEQGAGAAMLTFGYRLAMLVSGAGALWLSDVASWHVAYLAMAGFMLVGMATTLWMPEPATIRAALPTAFSVWLREAVWMPFQQFTTHPGWWLILLFVMLFRFADAYLGVMFNPFLLDIGFTKSQIAAIVKVYGLAATILGAFIGGWLVTRFGIYRTLMTTGIGHMLTNLLLVGQAHLGVEPLYLALCVISENLTAGMGTAAFVAYLGSLCQARFSATQYALLSSLASVARTMLSTTSGQTAEWLGWAGFFAFSSLLAVPSLLLLWYIHRHYRSSMDAPKETSAPMPKQG